MIQWQAMPWSKIFTSGPVWAIIIANFCTDWGLYTYLTNIPTFYNEVLFFNIESVSCNAVLPVHCIPVVYLGVVIHLSPDAAMQRC